MKIIIPARFKAYRQLKLLPRKGKIIIISTRKGYDIIVKKR